MKLCLLRQLSLSPSSSNFSRYFYFITEYYTSIYTYLAVSLANPRITEYKVRLRLLDTNPSVYSGITLTRAHTPD